MAGWIGRLMMAPSSRPALSGGETVALVVPGARPGDRAPIVRSPLGPASIGYCLGLGGVGGSLWEMPSAGCGPPRPEIPPAPHRASPAGSEYRPVKVNDQAQGATLCNTSNRAPVRALLHPTHTGADGPISHRARLSENTRNPSPPAPGTGTPTRTSRSPTPTSTTPTATTATPAETTRKLCGSPLVDVN